MSNEPSRQQLINDIIKISNPKNELKYKKHLGTYLDINLLKLLSHLKEDEKKYEQK